MSWTKSDPVNVQQGKSFNPRMSTPSADGRAGLSRSNSADTTSTVRKILKR